MVSFAEFFQQKSLPAMLGAVASASDHDLKRARRLAWLIRRFLGRPARAVPEGTQLIENEACVWVVEEALLMVVPLMVVMHKEIRQFIIGFNRRAGGSARWKAQLAVLAADRAYLTHLIAKGAMAPSGAAACTWSAMARRCSRRCGR